MRNMIEHKTAPHRCGAVSFHCQPREGGEINRAVDCPESDWIAACARDDRVKPFALIADGRCERKNTRQTKASPRARG